LPLPFRKPGTPSSTVAVQITRVFPNFDEHAAFGRGDKIGVIFKGRIWSAVRPSTLTLPPAVSTSVFNYSTVCGSGCASLPGALSGVNVPGAGAGALSVAGDAGLSAPDGVAEDFTVS